jgi:predicted HTH transcriptional regulator
VGCWRWASTRSSFFPQLNVTFVVIPATSKDAIPPDGPRFLDNRTIGGPIPVMVAETVTAIVRNTTASRYLAQLVTDGRIVATAPQTSKRRAYRRP